MSGRYPYGEAGRTLRTLFEEGCSMADAAVMAGCSMSQSRRVYIKIYGNPSQKGVKKRAIIRDAVAIIESGGRPSSKKLADTHAVSQHYTAKLIAMVMP